MFCYKVENVANNQRSHDLQLCNIYGKQQLIVISDEKDNIMYNILKSFKILAST